MNIKTTLIEGVLIIEPQVHGDNRGWFVEQYNADRYKAAGIDADFVQDNESLSAKGVVRGLHWQAGQYAQAKLGLFAVRFGMSPSISGRVRPLSVVTWR